MTPLEITFSVLFLLVASIGTITTVKMYNKTKLTSPKFIPPKISYSHPPPSKRIDKPRVMTLNVMFWLLLGASVGVFCVFLIQKWNEIDFATFTLSLGMMTIFALLLTRMIWILFQVVTTKKDKSEDFDNAIK